MTTLNYEATHAAAPAARQAQPDRSPAADGVSAGLAIVTAGVLSLMAVLGELFIDVVPFLVAYAGLAVWAARSASARPRWIAAGLLGLMVAFNAVYAVSDLSHPESAGPFIATVVVIGGALTTLVLAVRSATGRPVAAGRVWAGGGVVLAVAALGALLASAAVNDAVARPGELTIVGSDYEWPAEVVVPASAESVLVTNEDNSRHSFVIDGQADPVEVPARSSVRVPLDLTPGDYRFSSNVPGVDMTGTLRVQ